MDLFFSARFGAFSKMRNLDDDISGLCRARRVKFSGKDNWCTVMCATQKNPPYPSTLVWGQPPKIGEKLDVSKIRRSLAGCGVKSFRGIRPAFGEYVRATYHLAYGRDDFARADVRTVTSARRVDLTSRRCTAMKYHSSSQICPFLSHDPYPVSYTHLTMPTNREV